MGHAKLLETVSIAQSHAPALLAHFQAGSEHDCSAPNRSSLSEGSHLTGHNSLTINSSGLCYSASRGFHR
jgi:hypothetical protein